QSQTVELLYAQLTAASEVFDRMIGSSRNVAGVDFIMFDNSCGQIAILMEGCCALIAERVQHLGGNGDWPVRIQKNQPFDRAGPTSADEVPEDAFATATLDALDQSLLDAVALAEARGDRPTVNLLNRVRRDIDRYLWTIAPQDVEIHLLLSAD
ncbi:MAG: ferritin-like domain-containing protein, partial [Deltaproteobacteria bacterium]